MNTGMCIRPRCLCLPPVDGLCINDELKNKLKDVLISERRLTLGHMLGKGIAMTTNETCKQELSANSSPSLVIRATNTNL